MRVGDGSLELLDAAAQDEEEAVDELALAHKHSAGEARVWRLLVLVELDGGEEPHELLDLRGGEVAKAGERGQEGGEARVCRSAACPKPTSQVVRRHGHFAVGGCVDVAISELAPTVALCREPPTCSPPCGHCCSSSRRPGSMRERRAAPERGSWAAAAAAPWRESPRCPPGGASVQGRSRTASRSPE